MGEPSLEWPLPEGPLRTLQEGFSSFDQAAFQRTQHQAKQQEAVELLQAVDKLLPSSSEESDALPMDYEKHRKGKKKKKHKKRKSAKGVVVPVEKRKGSKAPYPRTSLQVEHVHQRASSSSSASLSNACYYVDPRGDGANLRYRGLYSSDIAAYERYDPTRFAQVCSPAYSRMDGQGEDDQHCVPAHINNRQYSPLNEDGRGGHRVGRGVLFLRGGKKPSHGALGTVKETSDACNEPITKEDDIRAQTQEYNRVLREQPGNVKLWLEFAEFQERVIRNGKAMRNGVLKRVIAEKKVAILEKALSHTPDSSELLLALLLEAAPLLDEDGLEQRWLEALRYMPHSIILWQTFLQQSRARCTNFSLAHLVDLHEHALSVLKTTVVQDARQRQEAELAMVDIMYQLCQCLLNAGHTERVVGIVQAALEFNFFSPEGWPEDALQSMFEDVWDSDGTLFIGDSNEIQGWGAAVQSQLSSGGASNKQEESCHSKPPESGWTGWRDLSPPPHASHSALHSEPPDEVAVHSGEDDSDDETDQAVDEVEYDEIDEALLLAQMGVDLDEKIEAAMENMTEGTLEHWLEMERAKETEQWHPVQQQREDGKPKRVVKSVHIRCALFQVHSPQSKDKLLDSCLQALRFPCMSDGAWWWEKSSEAKAFMLRLLKTLVVNNGPCSKKFEVIRSLLRMAQLKDGAQAAVELCKELLSVQRENCSLYRAYAQECALKSDRKSAHRIYRGCCSSMLSASIGDKILLAVEASLLEFPSFGGLDDGGLPVSIILTSTEQCIAAGLRPLAWLATSGAVSPVQKSGACLGLTSDEVVQCKRGFQSLLMKCVQAECPTTVVKAAALFELMHARGPLGVNVALGLYDQILSVLKPLPVDLLEERCSLAVQSAVLSPPCLPPRAAYTVVTKSLQHCITKNLLACLVELGLTIPSMSMRVNTYFHRLVDGKSTFDNEEVWLSLYRYASGRKNIFPTFTLKTILEKAVSISGPLRSSVKLWQLRFDFEKAHGRDVKKVWLRLLAACPGYKEGWLDGIQLSLAPPAEIAKYIEAMELKGVKVRTELLEAILAQLE